MKNFILIYVLFCIVSCTAKRELVISSSLESALVEARINDNNILLVFDSYGNPTNSVEKNLHDKEVIKALEEMLVVVLKCDDDRSVGERIRKMQREEFCSNSQPMYFVLNSNREVIKGPKGYCKIAELIDFINE